MSGATGPAATVSVVDVPEGWVVRVAGEVDIGNVEVLKEAIEGCLRGRPRAHLTFDLGGVRFMDSSTLAVLVRAAAQGAVVRVRNPSEVAAAVIAASGLGDVLVPET